MAKKRVHELAKQYDIPLAEVMKRLNAYGLEVKAAASAVDEAEADRALTGKTPKKSENGAQQQPQRATPCMARRATTPAARNQDVAIFDERILVHKVDAFDGSGGDTPSTRDPTERWARDAKSAAATPRPPWGLSSALRRPRETRRLLRG